MNRAAGSLRFYLRIGLGVGSLLVVGALFLFDHQRRDELVRADLLTGWVLFGAIVFLALLNARKKLSMIPVGRSSDWIAAHVAIGVAAAALYFIHARTVWPTGYELALALLFYLVVLSGIVGYVLQRVVPRELTDMGYEVIWERIPAEIADLREQVEAAVLECARETGSEVLPRLYRENLVWYFRKPRFVLVSLIGTGASLSWVRHRLDGVSSYLRGPELECRDFLRACAERKVMIDRAFALQGLLKCWLLIHVPATYGFIVMVLWHLLLVHVYAV